MKDCVQKLKDFTAQNDPTLVLNSIALSNNDIKRQWEEIKKNRHNIKRKIKAYKDVIFLIDCFERCVLTSPDDPKLRNGCKHEMLFAQYKAILGLKVLSEKLDAISILRDLNFPNLSKVEIDTLILRLQSIISKI